MTISSRRAALAALGAGVMGLGLAQGARCWAAPLASVLGGGVLRIAVYRDMAPWSYRDGGVLSGIDVDIAALFAKALGVRADFLEWIAGETVDDDLRDAVWRGTVLHSEPVDVMLHVPVARILSEHNDKTLIGAPYYQEAFALACARECRGGPMVLDGLKIGVELDSAPDMFMLGAYGGKYRSNVVHFPDGAIAAEALARGDVGAVLATRAQLQHGLRARPGAATYYEGPLTGLGQVTWPVGLAVRADSGDLLARLSQILSDAARSGALGAIFERHGVAYAAPTGA